MRSFLEFAIVPSNFLMLLIVAGLLLLVVRVRRLGLTSIVAGAVGLLLFGYSSAGELFMAPLVSRFPPVAVDEAPEPFGIIVFGSGVNEVHARHNGMFMNLLDGGESAPIAAILARRFPEAQIVITAGNGSGFPPAPFREADGYARILQEFGVEESRILLDGNSGTTEARVRASIDLMHEHADETWWVMASAHRMPRVIGTFRAQGADPLPYPIDFRWIPPIDPTYTYRFTAGLRMTDEAVKEWVGLVVYHLEGKTEQLFPEP